MSPKIIKIAFASISLIAVSGCGIFHHVDVVSEKPTWHHFYGPKYYYMTPRPANNIQYYSPRNYLNQNINNSINISGNSYREYDVTDSRVYFVDGEIHGIALGIDGTINQAVVVERKRLRVPTCNSVMQSVQAINYNSFQYINCH